MIHELQTECPELQQFLELLYTEASDENKAKFQILGIWKPLLKALGSFSSPHIILGMYYSLS